QIVHDPCWTPAWQTTEQHTSNVPMSPEDPADAVIRAASRSIAQYAAEAASREPPWDGYGGLVRICDDESLREPGVVCAAVARQPTAPALAPCRPEAAAAATTCQGKIPREPRPAAGAPSPPPTAAAHPQQAPPPPPVVASDGAAPKPARTTADPHNTHLHRSSQGAISPIAGNLQQPPLIQPPQQPHQQPHQS
ncbi:hypothetical protein Agub_g923, partial [Astrephomene gubernaculifera]